MYSRRDVEVIFPAFLGQSPFFICFLIYFPYLFLEKKSNTRKGVFFQRFLVIGTYLNGTYAYQNCDTTFEKQESGSVALAQSFFTVENKAPIGIMLPFVLNKVNTNFPYSHFSRGPSYSP